MPKIKSLTASCEKMEDSPLKDGGIFTVGIIINLYFARYPTTIDVESTRFGGSTTAKFTQINMFEDHLTGAAYNISKGLRILKLATE